MLKTEIEKQNHNTTNNNNDNDNNYTSTMTKLVISLRLLPRMSRGLPCQDRLADSTD